MMIVNHGTSYENFQKILTGEINKKQNWVNSDPAVVYCYINEEDDDAIYKRAYDSALMCAAIQKSKHDKVIILSIEVEDNEVSQDQSDDFGKYNLDKTRVYLDQKIFMDKIVNGDYCYFEGVYEPGKRWMYLYNLYHCTCGLDGITIDPYIVDKEEVYKACDEWYEKQPKEAHAYEHHFENKGDGYKYHILQLGHLLTDTTFYRSIDDKWS